MKTLVSLAILLFSSILLAQNSYKITYEKFSNGTLIENQDPIFVFTNDKVTQVVSKNNFENKKRTWKRLANFGARFFS